ncbi:ATP-binding protein [Streptomyces sp. NPDC091879]|uniref:ATP-binding protein n=1 Tax=Streptomyces sp. NPDC091879 TaxID=3366006 RepID=UPI0037F69E6E
MDEAAEDTHPARTSTALPLETSLALDGDGSRIAQARHVTTAFLEEVRDHGGIPVAQGTVEIAQLIVSELVTNARKYAPGPALLHLRVHSAVLIVELWDSSPVVPAAQVPDPERVGQHGLEIVAALAQALTVEPTTVGKRITAHITLATTSA